LNSHPPYPGLGIAQYIQATNGIIIGRNVRIGPGVKIVSANHELSDYSVHTKTPPIVIGDDCWLGANAVILPGVELESHVIVAAGAVVASSVHQSNVVIGGIPAVVLKEIGPYTGERKDRVPLAGSMTLPGIKE
jgi:acetyltransferase-like isoleucine patch superfamily enzyme